MLTLRRPDEAALAALVTRSHTAPLSYPAGLLERVNSERRWFVDRHQEVIGHGPGDFDRAKHALRQWTQFAQAWTEPARPLADIAVGVTAGYTAKAVGLWWSYCCHILEVIDNSDEREERFGFVYGTVSGHAERGEERFLVTHDLATGDVTYQLFAMSRPGRWFTWCGVPIGRLTQAKFRRDSSAAMQAFVAAH